MVIGSLSTMGQGHGELPKIIQKVLQYLQKQDFKKMADGKYPIQGDQCYATVQRYQTRLPEACLGESHEKFIDVQFIAEGEECMGWCPMSPDLKVVEPYDAKKDIVFYEKLIPDSELLLSEKYYVVLYPEDVHSPGRAVDGECSAVTKVVVKVSVDLF